MRWPWQCRGGHGGVRWCVCLGEEGRRRHKRGASGSRATWRTSWGSGTAWAAAGRAGAVGFNGARQVLDSVSADSAPAIAARREGQA